MKQCTALSLSSVCLCNLRNTSKQAKCRKCGGLKAHYFHIHTSACYCGVVGHWRRNESEYKNCRRCISTSPYTCWLLTKIIRLLCVGFTASSLSSLMVKESRVIRVARQRFGNLLKASWFKERWTFSGKNGNQETELSPWVTAQTCWELSLGRKGAHGHMTTVTPLQHYYSCTGACWTLNVVNKEEGEQKQSPLLHYVLLFLT